MNEPLVVARYRKLSPAGAAASAAVLLTALLGPAVGRLLFEALFPHALYLGRLPANLALSLLFAGIGLLLWRLLLRRRQSPVEVLVPFLPFALNLLYLAQEQVALVQSRLLFGASLWLASLLLYRLLDGKRFVSLWLPAALLPIYLLTMGHTVGRADTFEFQVVIPRLGIAHPTGYPLYMLLGKLFTYLPVGSVAWRINLASVVFALSAVQTLYLIGRRLTSRYLPPLLAALLYGLTPTFWSQAIEAEVYALHSLIVAVALYLMLCLLELQDAAGEAGRPGRQFTLHTIGLSATLGLGLTNHLTTLLLIPAAGLTMIISLRRNRVSLRALGLAAAAFLLPLLLYAYLPLRWVQVNLEPMGRQRFIEWVVGGRFQGALQWDAWLQDSARYGVVSRLFLAEWQPLILLLPVAVGFFVLFRRSRQKALVLLLAWLGYVFYGLNYYVPDLAVFLLPAWLVMAVWWAVGFALLLELPDRLGTRVAPLLQGILIVAVPALIVLPASAARWQDVDRSVDDGRLAWASAALAEVPPGAAVLADSEKFPPLYYLQQAEGVRPDLEIMVLPDESAYRAEVVARTATGQPVYLARFLPGLESAYHLRSAGPLVEVGTEPWTQAPEEMVTAELLLHDVRLLGYDLETTSPYDPAAASLTLFWQATAPISEPLFVYMRWAGEGYATEPLPRSGQHPAGNYYPTVAWTPGEVVPDFHLLPRPVVSDPELLMLQVALGPPFAPPEELEWHTVTQVSVGTLSAPNMGRLLRAQVGLATLSVAEVQGRIRPGAALPLLVGGNGPGEELVFSLLPVDDARHSPHSWQDSAFPDDLKPFVRAVRISTATPPGRYAVYAHHPLAQSRCGWMQAPRAGCALTEVEVSGVPLPPDAANYDDKIALLALDIADSTLRPGGQLAVTLDWQSLTDMSEDYTLFLQVLDAHDRIVGQVDSWPLQGTYPTSTWPVGERVTDPYLLQLDEELPPGQYRLAVGWYLLGTLQRLPLLDEDGSAIDDKLIAPGLSVLE